MKLTKYVKLLSASLDKNKIQDDLKVTIAELNELNNKEFNLMREKGVYVSSDNKPTVKTLESKKCINWEKTFDRGAKGVKGKNLVDKLSKALPKLIENAESISDKLDKDLVPEVHTDGIPADQAVLIRACEHIYFLSTLTPLLLNAIMEEEIAAMNGEKPTTLKIVYDYINSHMFSYSMLFDLYTQENKKLFNLFEKTPDVIMSPVNADLISGTMSSSALDPLTSGTVLNFTLNPIFHLRVAFTNWQDSRYKNNKATREALQLRVRYLEELAVSSGKRNPSLEREIIYNQGRINVLSQDIAEYDDELRELKERYE